MSSGSLSGVRLGLLHTVPALAASFQASLVEAAPGVDLVHLADPSLLATAVSVGVTDSVRRQVRRHVDHLIASGAEGVLVTCSSIGEAVDDVAAQLDIPVVRVDAQMASGAVDVAAQRGIAAGREGRIIVLATLQATLGPTGRLIQRSIGDAQIGVDFTVVEGAAEARNNGDNAVHDQLVADAVDEAAVRADVIVLAQASMAAVIAGRNIPVPVLTSPDSGMAAFLESVRRARDEHPNG